jgi:predicted dehydrogenase
MTAAGIVGPGGIGTLHADCLRRLGVELIGVVGSSPESARSHAARLGARHGLDSVEALVALPELDVVHVCSPNALHAEHCRVALEAGKHVVAEKPLATDVADAVELTALAHDFGVVNAVCQNYRFYPMIGMLRAEVARGALGRVHLVHGTYLLEELLTADRGHWMLDPEQMGPALTLADVGVHWWDLAEHVTGLAVEAVICETRAARRNGGDARGEDTAALMMRLARNAIATATICQAAPGHGNTITIEVLGDEASASWDIRASDTLTVRPLSAPASVHTRDLPPADASLRGWHLPAGQPEGHADAFRDLLREVYAHVAERSREVRYPTFADGLRGMRVLEAVLESTVTRSWAPVQS